MGFPRDFPAIGLQPPLASFGVSQCLVVKSWLWNHAPRETSWNPWNHASIRPTIRASDRAICLDGSKGSCSMWDLEGSKVGDLQLAHLFSSSFNITSFHFGFFFHNSLQANTVELKHNVWLPSCRCHTSFQLFCHFGWLTTRTWVTPCHDWAIYLSPPHQNTPQHSAKNVSDLWKLEIKGKKRTTSRNSVFICLMTPCWL